VLHIIVLIFGFTGILGREIEMDAIKLVWFRVLIASVTLLVFAPLLKKSLLVKSKHRWQYLGTGVLVAAHWVFFFAAIKESNISIALAMLASTSLFVALVEPMLTGSRIDALELLLGVAVIAGLALIVSFEFHYYLGIVLGLMAAIFAALFGTLNSMLIRTGEAYVIGFYELLAGLVVLSLILIVSEEVSVHFFSIGSRNWLLLLALGTIATAFATVGAVWVTRELTPFTVALTINLEPVYSIILAVILYPEEEKMSPQFYLGAAVILAALFINAFVKSRRRKTIIPN
jgi:drug/metabolite transporter (DMT)-like permease